jgi:phosphinothricin acetyltransferase
VGDTLIIRPATPGDACAIAGIYAPYVRDTAITFEVDPPDTDEMRARITDKSAHFPWLVAERDGRILGYAYAGTFHPRAAYRWMVETTVYVAEDQGGHGVGRALYDALFDRLRDQRFQAAIVLIALPNPASVALHEKMGFMRCGTYEKVGYKFGAWHDVGLWQLDFGLRPDRPAEPLKPR